MNKRTRQAIIESFQKLVSQKSFDKITVDMILQDAEVSRATFYRYFKDKYDVMNQIHIIKVENCIAMSHSYEELFYYMLLFSKSNMLMIQQLFSSTGVNSFSSFLAEQTARVIERITRKNRGDQAFTKEETLQVDLVCHGISHVSRRWVSEDYDISPKEAAHAIAMLLPEQLRNYWC